MTESTKWARAELYDLSSDSLESTNLLLVRPGDEDIQAVTSQMIKLLLKYTESDEYDVSLWPSSMVNNIDYTRASFDVGAPCWDFNGGKVNDAMEMISIGEIELSQIIGS